MYKYDKLEIESISAGDLGFWIKTILGGSLYSRISTKVTRRTIWHFIGE